MSAAIDSLFRQGVKSIQACGYRRTFKILTGALAGQSFVGTIVIGQTIDPDMPLGSDLREASFLDVLNDECPALEIQNQIKEGNAIWKVVKRVDNPVDVEVRYEVVKVVQGKDT